VDRGVSIDATARCAGNERLRRTPPATAGRAHTVSLLSVSPVPADHDELRQALQPGEWTICKAHTLSTALAIFVKKRFPVVVCESDLGQDSWREMLTQIAAVGSSPPFFIVTSRLADERLWVEGLNVGAYDVLVKPFDVAELKRVLDAAWCEWRDRDRGPHQPSPGQGCRRLTRQCLQKNHLVIPSPRSPVNERMLERKWKYGSEGNGCGGNCHSERINRKRSASEDRTARVSAVVGQGFSDWIGSRGLVSSGVYAKHRRNNYFTVEGLIV
jgi:CheY-like chemotaxis protein